MLLCQREEKRAQICVARRVWARLSEASRRGESVQTPVSASIKPHIKPSLCLCEGTIVQSWKDWEMRKQKIKKRNCGELVSAAVFNHCHGNTDRGVSMKWRAVLRVFHSKLFRLYDSCFESYLELADSDMGVGANTLTLWKLFRFTSHTVNGVILLLVFLQSVCAALITWSRSTGNDMPSSQYCTVWGRIGYHWEKGIHIFMWRPNLD